LGVREVIDRPFDALEQHRAPSIPTHFVATGVLLTSDAQSPTGHNGHAKPCHAKV
jgi:hypothetical protein